MDLQKKSIITEKLKSIKTVVTHDNCTDGLASALILNSCLFDRKILFHQYNSPEFLRLEASPNMLFVDISPPKERVQEFIDAGAIVADHHKSAKPIIQIFGDNGIFADEDDDPGVCGAVLMFEHVWKPIMSESYYDTYNSQLHSMKLFAELAGIRDTWQSQNPLWLEACKQAEVLKFWPKKYWFDIGIFSTRWFDMFRIGPELWDKVQERVKYNIDHAYKFTSNFGTKVIIFEDKLLTSDTAEFVGAGADLIVGFHCDFDGKKQNLQFSLRSHTNFDCAKLASCYNGGGHTKAAGCMIYLDDNSKQPYKTFQDLLEQYEKQINVKSRKSEIITEEMKKQFMENLRSPETQAKLRELEKKHQNEREERRRACQVDYELLRKRITI